MAKSDFLIPNLLGGQNDTRIEEGTEVPRWVVVRNSRLRDGSLSMRPGMRRIAVCGTDATSLDFVAASSHYVEIPSAPHHTLTWPFTLAFLIEPDSYTGTHGLIAWNHATDWPFKAYLDAAVVKVTLTDTDDATETITLHTTAGATGEVHACQLVVDASGGWTARVYSQLTTGVYESNETTGTLSVATNPTMKAPGGNLYFGRDDSGDYYDGHLDYVRAYRYAAPNFDMAWSRWPSPRQDYMLMDYGGEVDANDWVIDRSPYENHGEVKNSLSTDTALAINPAPVQAMRTFLERLEPRLLVIAGGRVHKVEL